MDIKEAAKILNKPEEMISGLLNAGLLRRANEKTINPESVDDFIKFGCQWGSGTTGTVPDHIKELPPFLSSMATAGAKADKGIWIALAFFKPNPLYYLPINALVRAAGTGIMMDEPSSCRFGNQLVFIHPDQSGELSTLLVMSEKNAPATYKDISDSYTQAIKRVTAEISFRHDRFLHVVHSCFISLPSGQFFFENDNFPIKQKFFELGPLAMKIPDELFEAKVLYSEAISMNEPFMRFLLFFRSFELSSEALSKLREYRTGWRKDKRKDVFLHEETLPNKFLYGEQAGQGFGTALKAMRADYRNAVAHVGLHGEAKLRAYDTNDRSKVRAATATMHYMAKVRLINFDYMMAPAEVRPNLGQFPNVTF